MVEYGSNYARVIALSHLNVTVSSARAVNQEDSPSPMKDRIAVQSLILDTRQRVGSLSFPWCVGPSEVVQELAAQSQRLGGRSGPCEIAWSVNGDGTSGGRSVVTGH